MRLTFIILYVGITLQTHTVFLTTAVAVTHHHILASTAHIAVAIGGLRTLLLALQTEEARLAVLAANAMVEVVVADTLAVAHQAAVALAVAVAALAGRALQAEVALHAVHTLAFRTPSLIANALT